MKRKSKVLARRNLNLKFRLQAAETFSNTESFETLTNNLDEISRNFFRSQLQCINKKPQGRRFTIDDKIMALALFKQSGPGYHLLSRMFALPSRVTLMKLLNSIPINPDMNECIFKALEETGKTLKPLERHCIIMFDEMSLTSNLKYNQHYDVVDGFEDYGDRKSDKIADHAQVFMLRGLYKIWKQPISYQFVKGAAKYIDIVKALKEIILAVETAGFNVVATVCDQGSNNVAAINYLVRETKPNYLSREELQHHIFELKPGKRIIPIYDTPHLLKGIRNNLLNKSIFYTKNGLKQEAKWEDIETAWYLDNFSGELRMMPKITKFHVDKVKIKKMKVSTCSQVLSHTISSAINLMARSGYSVQGVQITERATETADFLKFCDNLFDSVNRYVSFNRSGKIFRTSVDVLAEETIHTKFWHEAIRLLKTIECVDGQGKKSVPPTFKNWIITLKNFLLLRKELKSLGFKTP